MNLDPQVVTGAFKFHSIGIFFWFGSSRLFLLCICSFRRIVFVVLIANYCCFPVSLAFLLWQSSFSQIFLAVFAVSNIVLAPIPPLMWMLLVRVYILLKDAVTPEEATTHLILIVCRQYKRNTNRFKWIRMVKIWTRSINLFIDKFQ